jgi:hypothetical protein
MKSTLAMLVLRAMTGGVASVEPKELRRRALEMLEKATEECPQPEAVDLVASARQLLVMADDLEDDLSDAKRPEDRR